MSNLWKTILIIGGVGLIVALMTAGLVIPLVAMLLLVAVLGGGALLYRKAGPPSR